MLRSTLIVAGAALVCASAFAQQQFPSSRLQPIKATPKKVTVDYVTGKRIPAGSQVLAANIQTIYNNTCTWATAAYYGPYEQCEEMYDEGRIPSTAPGSGSPVSWDGFSFGYCTYNAASFRCNIAFANNAGGQCAGLVAQTPPPWATSAVYTDIDLSGLGLPGSTADNFQACWIVGITNLGLCVQADGDGVFDGNPTTDLFTWGFRHKMPTQPSGQEGLIVSADPNVAAGGSCTYNIPCGTDPFGGGPCGTGLDTDDAEWINADGTAIGVSPPTNCPNGIAQYGFGTNCYWFGGWPANPFDSYYFTMEGGRTCATCTAGFAYCRNNPSLDGCTPALSSSGGLPSLGNLGFTVNMTGGPGQKNGIIFFGTTGPNFAPFSNGWLCVAPPLNRLPVTNSGGTAGGCDGTQARTLGDIQAHPNGPFTAGTQVWVQSWNRDDPVLQTTAVSSGYTFTICP